ncbi:MAG: PTS sugar transporter subunit IIA [Termitinemataceae bacterium]|nr:MAG: PTS sugar transporter subunit IIA [Termitinemataceae bacterium]
MEIIKPENIVLGQAKEGKDDVIKRAGKMLVDLGYVAERYIEGMLARDKSLSCAIGNSIAIPHGEIDYKNEIIETGLVVITYNDAIDWNGMPVHIVIGIAAKGGEHNDILGNIVDILDNNDDVKNFLAITDKNKICKMLLEGV